MIPEVLTQREPAQTSDRGAASLLPRSARPGDASRICELVNAWAEQGLTVRRTVQDVLGAIGEFIVVEREGPAGATIIACGALVVHSPEIAEIRSVACDPEHRGCGAGAEVVRYLVETARSLRIDDVVLLTKIPTFFARFGFRQVDASSLPSDFVQAQIVARGRTLQGRAVMLRDCELATPRGSGPERTASERAIAEFLAAI